MITKEENKSFNYFNHQCAKWKSITYGFILFIYFFDKYRGPKPVLVDAAKSHIYLHDMLSKLDFNSMSKNVL